MQWYDITLKSLLLGRSGKLFQALTGSVQVEWLGTEFSEVKSLRVDCLFRAADGQLIHVEFQSSNDTDINNRMLQYAVRIYQEYDHFPRQIVLYIGSMPLQMPTTLEEEGLSFHYELVDIRTLNGEELLDSSEIEDNVLALLTKDGENQAVVMAILRKIAGLRGEDRENAVKKLMILAGLRKPAAKIIVEEMRNMAINYDVRENYFYQEAFAEGEAKGKAEGEAKGKAEGEAKGKAEGEAKGKAEGEAKGKAEGEAKGKAEGMEEGARRQAAQFFKLLLSDRFGKIPEWIDDQTRDFSARQIEALSMRALQCDKLEDLFR